MSGRGAGARFGLLVLGRNELPLLAVLLFMGSLGGCPLLLSFGCQTLSN